MQLTIAAAWACAIVATLVFIIVVAIVARFVSRLPLLKVNSADTVTAPRDAAGQQAAILVRCVAVIAGLIANLFTDRSVADLVSRAQRVLLGTDRSRTDLKIKAGNPITAERLYAVVSTRVEVITVTIIALFVAGEPCLNIIANHPVAAMGDAAVTEAFIVIKVVAVIALFAEVQDAIATNRRLSSTDR